MTVYIDDEPVDVAGTDLDSVLAEARRRLEPEGRIVVDVELDGQRLDSVQLAQQRRSNVDRLQVRLTTCDPRALATTTLHQVRHELETARQEQTEAAELLQQDKQSEAVERIASAVNRWQHTQQAVVGASGLVGIDVNDLMVADQSAQAVIGELIEQLRGLRGLLAARDSVGLADVLLYEWPQTIDQWDRLVGAVIDAIQDADHQDAAPEDIGPQDDAHE